MIKCPYMCGNYRQDIGILLCRPTGTLTAEHVADITTCRDCIERAGLSQVNRFHDLTAITSVDIHFQDVIRLCESEEELRDPEHPIKACYLVSNDLLYGTIRMYAALIESRGVEVHVGYDVNELADVLGIDAAQLAGE